MSCPSKYWTIISLFILAFSGPVMSQSTLIDHWDSTTHSFEGNKVEQARLLLRPVLPFGHLGDAPDSLPGFLDSLLQELVVVEAEAFRGWLDSLGIEENEIGGSSEIPLCENLAGDTACYFVIHDASTPNYGQDSFPTDIDSATWDWNDASRWSNTNAAHMFITRTGCSVSPHDLSVPWRATKLELRIIPDSISKGLFLHFELIQPRRCDTAVSLSNDALAPDPGFTRTQYRRLALAYIACHIRKGEWLVPAYHAVLDNGIPGAHDDPQHFDLEVWCDELRRLVREVRSE